MCLVRSRRGDLLNGHRPVLRVAPLHSHRTNLLVSHLRNLRPSLRQGQHLSRLGYRPRSRQGDLLNGLPVTHPGNLRVSQQAARLVIHRHNLRPSQYRD